MFENRILKDASGVYVQYRRVLFWGHVKLWWSYYQQGIPEYTSPWYFPNIDEALEKLRDYFHSGEQVEVIERRTLVVP